MPENVLPKRVYVSNETGQPFDSDIRDADTGELVPGVFEIHVTRGSIEVEVTTHWPLKEAQQEAIDHPDASQHHGVTTKRVTYPLKKLQAESW